MKVCQSLAQTGAEVTLYVPGKTHTPWAGLSSFYGVTTPFDIHWIACTQALKRYDLAFLAVQRAMRMKADLLYTWLPQAAVFGLRRGLPAVLEVHDRPTGRFGPWLLRQTVAVRGRKRLAIITHALKDAIMNEFNIKLSDKIVVIAPNGTDLERYQKLPEPTEARRNLKLVDKVTAVYAGHFYAGRGMELLMELARAIPQVQFIWVGGNSESVEFWRNRIAVNGINNINLTGFIENRLLPMYQAAGDILLMPYETSIAGSSGGNSADICSPMKMFEYMACGRAILSSDLPVLHEVLNNENAVFCPPEDLDGWKTAIEMLLGNPERMKQLGNNARADAEKYTWKMRTERVLAGFI
jgi:glycosyltransferase involved in cell wall biosynthesis